MQVAIIVGSTLVVFLGIFMCCRGAFWLGMATIIGGFYWGSLS